MLRHTAAWLANSRTAVPHNGPMKNRMGFAAALAAALLLLSACTVTTTFDPTLSGRVHFSTSTRSDRLLTEFQPTRGMGAIYRNGDEIAFGLNARRAGYVTLTYQDSAGQVAAFSRNIPVRRGYNRISGPDSGHVFVVNAPRGLMQVRASFTPARTNENRVTFRGRGGSSHWNSLLVIDVGQQSVYDVVQTYVEVR